MVAWWCGAGVVSYRMVCLSGTSGMKDDVYISRIGMRLGVCLMLVSLA